MQPFPFDVVVFDLDGTLADTAPDLTAALNHALDQLGAPRFRPRASATWSATAPARSSATASPPRGR
jgi:phosphoglycolate phosphatase-like HAD superfamily hydrolase